FPCVLLLCLSFLNWIGCGNQRETDRQRAAAPNSKKGGKTKDDGLTPEQRRERDAKALQEKATKKAAQAVGVGFMGGKMNKK
ncbi:Small EDRK-rich factor 1, partial [Bienertia sinuspersici]